MKRIRKDNAVYEETGRIVLRNYPPDLGTFAYICPVYREFKDEEFGWKEMDGEPIYLHNMNDEQKTLAIILGNAQNALYKSLREKFTLG